jgi:hypothetical protein
MNDSTAPGRLPDSSNGAQHRRKRHVPFQVKHLRECKVAYLAFAQFFSDDHWAIKLKAFDRILNCPVKLLGVKQRPPMYSSAPVFGTLFAAANVSSGQNHHRAMRATETNT